MISIVWGMPGLVRHAPLQDVEARPTAGCVWVDLRDPALGLQVRSPKVGEGDPVHTPNV